MRKGLFIIVTAVAMGGVAVAWAQQKPVATRTTVVVYKSPT